VRIETAIEEFLFACRNDRGLSPKTMTAYATDLRQFRAFVLETGNGCAVERVDKEDIRRFIAHAADRVLRRVRPFPFSFSHQPGSPTAEATWLPRQMRTTHTRQSLTIPEFPIPLQSPMRSEGVLEPPTAADIGPSVRAGDNTTSHRRRRQQQHCVGRGWCESETTFDVVVGTLASRRAYRAASAARGGRTDVRPYVQEAIIADHVITVRCHNRRHEPHHDSHGAIGRCRLVGAPGRAPATRCIGPPPGQTLSLFLFASARVTDRVGDMAARSDAHHPHPPVPDYPRIPNSA
jgi:hypothetical protein